MLWGVQHAVPLAILVSGASLVGGAVGGIARIDRELQVAAPAPQEREVRFERVFRPRGPHCRRPGGVPAVAPPPAPLIPS